MASKVYVKVKEETDTDGEPLQVATTYESKIDKPSFIIFLDK